MVQNAQGCEEKTLRETQLTKCIISSQAFSTIPNRLADALRYMRRTFRKASTSDARLDNFALCGVYLPAPNHSDEVHVAYFPRR